MTHYRQQIREKVVAIIKALNIPDVGESVVGSIFFAQRDLPFVCVYVDAEAVEPSGGVYERDLSVIVKVFYRAGERVEDLVDDCCARIETGLDPKCGGLALNGWLSEVRFERSGEGSEEYMAAELAYVFRYDTRFQNPTIAAH